MSLFIQQTTVPNSVNQKISGLNTNANQLTDSNKLTIADNVVLNKIGAVSNRQGFDYWVGSLSSPVNSFFEFQNTPLWYRADGTLWYSTALNTQTQLAGSYFPPNATGSAIHTAGLGGNLYLTTSKGIQKMTAVASAPTLAGAPYGLDVSLAASGTGGGFCSGSTQVAYRVCWLRTDANNAQTRGVPSQPQTFTASNRVTITSLTRSGSTATATVVSHTFSNGDSVTIANASSIAYNGTFVISGVTSTQFTYTVVGTPTTPDTSTTITAEKQQNVALTFTVPGNVIANDQYEIYRTQQSANANTYAGDTMYLIYRGTWTAGSTVSYTDTTLDANLSTTPLYTNSSVEGIAQANYAPPLALDIDLFSGYLWFANTRQPQSISLNLITATGSLVAGTSSITFSNGSISETYVFDTAENIGTKHFQLVTSSTPADNIHQTCNSLIRVINRASSNFYAEYTSGQNDAPGIFRVWMRDVSASQFFGTANATGTGNAFSPILPTSGNTIASDGTIIATRVYFSKYNQPESVPLANFFDIGDRNYAIQRIIALTNSLIVIKEDGLFYLNGSAPSFSVKQFNVSTFCVAPKSAVRMNNQVYMLSNQGVVEFSEQNFQILSFDIEPDINAAIALSNIKSLSFGQAFESQRQYLLFLPNSSTDTVCQSAYVYNFIVQGWTRFTKKALASSVLRLNSQLYLSSGQENAVLAQRNTRTNLDFSDEEISVTITSVVDSKTLVLTYNYTPVLFDQGFTVHQSGRVAKINSLPVALGSHSFQVTLDRAFSNWATGAATVRIPIYSHIRFHQDPCGNAAVAKAFQDYTFILEQNTVSAATLEVTSNQYGFLTPSIHSNTLLYGWGLNAWGALWGDDFVQKNIPFRENVPLTSITGEMLTIGFKHSVSTEPYSILETSVSFTPISGVTTQGVSTG
jgi:hypothetical protein